MNCNLSNGIAYNGQGLALFWNLENVRPEPMPIKDKKVKLTNQSQIEKRLLEQKPNKEPPPKFQRPAKITPNPMLPACANYAVFFQSFSCPPESCNRIIKLFWVLLLEI